MMIAELADPWNSPQSMAPPAPTPEYLGSDRRPILTRVASACMIVTTLVVLLRFYSKRFGGAPSGWDDFMLLGAWLGNIGVCIVAIGYALLTTWIVMVKIAGVGRHVELATPQQLVNWGKCMLAFQTLYFCTISLPKLSIVYLYIRVFNWRGGTRWGAYLLLALISLSGLGLITAGFLQCRPLAKWWSPAIPGHCFNIQGFFHAQGIPGIVLDVFILALPIRTILNLRLPVYKKVELIVVCSFASLGIVAAIVRVIRFFQTRAFEDRTMASVPLTAWSIAETSSYIVTASLPSMRPLFVYYTPERIKDKLRMWGESYGSSGAMDTIGRAATSHRYFSSSMLPFKFTSKSGFGYSAPGQHVGNHDGRNSYRHKSQDAAYTTQSHRRLSHTIVDSDTAYEKSMDESLEGSQPQTVRNSMTSSNKAATVHPNLLLNSVVGKAAVPRQLRKIRSGRIRGSSSAGAGNSGVCEGGISVQTDIHVDVERENSDVAMAMMPEECLRNSTLRHPSMPRITVADAPTLETFTFIPRTMSAASTTRPSSAGECLEPKAASQV